MAVDTRRRAGTLWLWGTFGLTGGLVWFGAVMVPASTTSPGELLGWLLFAAAPGHVAATGWLLSFPDVRSEIRRRRARYVWAPLSLSAGSAVLAACLAPRTLAWLLLPFFAWQFWHFHKQNLGLVALVSTSRGVPPPTVAERRVLAAGATSAIAMLCSHPDLLQVGLRPEVAHFGALALMGFGGAMLAGTTFLARRRSAGYCFAYATTLLFWAPVFVFRTPYAAVGGLTLAHGFQYLVLAAMATTGDSRRSLALMVLAVVAGGLVLSVASHQHGLSPGLRIVYGVYLGAVMSHFVVDARLWRLRDAFPRRFLASRIPDLLPPLG